MYYSTLGEAKAQKVKMIKLKKFGWHYKIQKFVFGSVVSANPTSFKNLCPYFWMLSLALLFSPFVAIAKALLYPMKIAADYSIRTIQPTAEDWLSDANEFKFYMYLEGWNTNSKDIPLVVKEKYKTKSKAIESWIQTKFGAKPTEMSAIQKTNFKKWKYQMAMRRTAAEAKRRELKRIREANKAKIVSSIQKRMSSLDKIGLVLTTFGNWLVEIFSFKTPEAIIRFSKKLFGGIITLFLFAASYIVVTILVRLTMLSIGAFNLATFLSVLGWIGTAIVGIGLVVLIAYLIALLIKYLESREDNPWWVKAGLVIGNGVRWFAMTIIWLPIYFIFVSVLWNFVAVSLIGGAFKSFGRMLVAVTGVFGEYFSASYNDYCPGIEWVDENGKETI